MRGYLRQVTEKLTFWRHHSMPKAPTAFSRDGDSLRELANLIVEENVDLAHLPRFLRFLLSERLIELSWTARKTAGELSRQFSDLSPDDVAYLLRERAKVIDSNQSSQSAA